MCGCGAGDDDADGGAGDDDDDAERGRRGHAPYTIWKAVSLPPIGGMKHRSTNQNRNCHAEPVRQVQHHIAQHAMTGIFRIADALAQVPKARATLAKPMAADSKTNQLPLA